MARIEPEAWIARGWPRRLFHGAEDYGSSQRQSGDSHIDADVTARLRAVLRGDTAADNHALVALDNDGQAAIPQFTHHLFAHLLAFDLSGHASGASPSPPLQIWRRVSQCLIHHQMAFVFRAGSAEVAHVPVMG